MTTLQHRKRPAPRKLAVPSYVFLDGDVALLSIYSLGLAIPFLMMAAFTGAFLDRVRGLGRLGRYVQVASGAILVLVGVAIMTGTLTSFGTWLLQNVPIFQYLVV